MGCTPSVNEHSTSSKTDGDQQKQEEKPDEKRQQQQDGAEEKGAAAEKNPLEADPTASLPLDDALKVDDVDDDDPLAFCDEEETAEEKKKRERAEAAALAAQASSFDLEEDLSSGNLRRGGSMRMNSMRKVEASKSPKGAGGKNTSGQQEKHVLRPGMIGSSTGHSGSVARAPAKASSNVGYIGPKASKNISKFSTGSGLGQD